MCPGIWLHSGCRALNTPAPAAATEAGGKQAGTRRWRGVTAVTGRGLLEGAMAAAPGQGESHGERGLSAAGRSRGRVSSRRGDVVPRQTPSRRGCLSAQRRQGCSQGGREGEGGWLFSGASGGWFFDSLPTSFPAN